MGIEMIDKTECEKPRTGTDDIGPAPIPKRPRETPFLGEYDVTGMAVIPEGYAAKKD